MIEANRLDCTELAAAFKSGEITPSVALADYLDRIERYNGQLNAYLAVYADSAREAAKAAEERIAAGKVLSRLDGVPIALKDNIDVAGCVTTNGMKRGHVAAHDAHVVERLQAAGLVIIGKLNMHEGALGGTTDNPHHGRTYNPWREGYTPGGSSGGSGAAVSARLCAAALGTDTLGSVRLPAALCGVSGAIATAGIISTRGVVPLSYAYDHVGPLCRSVRDLAFLLDILIDPDPRSIESVKAPEGWALDFSPRKADLSGRTFGVPRDLFDVEVDGEVAASFAEAVSLAESLGGEIREVELPGRDLSRSELSAILVFENDAAHALAAELEDSPESFSDYFYRMLDYGRGASAGRLAKSQRTMLELGHEIRALFADIDVLLTPTTARLPFSFDTLTPPGNLADFTGLANYAACPAVTLPCGLSGDGLPIGLQVMTPPFADGLALNVAAALEQAMNLSLAPPDFA